MGTRSKGLNVLKKQSIYLNPAQIADWPVAKRPIEGGDLKAPLRQAMHEIGLENNYQVAGNHFAIGCVALEITQRCNLDCTACYLSDYSEVVHDLPLEEIFRRIDAIAAHYGPNTNVQVTGGDPTLRKPDELIAIIAHLASHRLRPALFTNGIKATRSLLSNLKNAGLKDVAFHVDITQERNGYKSEQDLNFIREEYINRARGLGLQIIFNTTILAGNLGDVEMLSRFFTERADVVHLASFQMIADTGRGTIRDRADSVTQDRVMELISKGAGIPLNFNFPQIGHLECNRYTKCLVAGDDRVCAFEERDRNFYSKLFLFTRNLFLDRHSPITSILKLAAKLTQGHLNLLISGFSYALRKVWALRRGLLKTKGKANLITFYIHNFMHADALDIDRCKACVFVTMTRDGPVSMCVHNAKRDHYILQEVESADGSNWQPLGAEKLNLIESTPTKRLKGRVKADRLNKTQQQIPPTTGNIGEIETRRRKLATASKYN